MLQTLACTKSIKIKTLLIKEKAERERRGESHHGRKKKKNKKGEDEDWVLGKEGGRAENM